jgi:SAM-dependent methyltransferase
VLSYGAPVSGPTPCPRCGGPSRLLLVARDRHGRGDVPPRAVRLCISATCGVGFTDPVPGGASAAPAAAPQGGAAQRLAARIVGAGMAPLAARVSPGGLVIDVGAGSGLRARALAGRGFHVVAVEPDPVEEARARTLVADLPSGTVEVVRADVDEVGAVMRGRTADAAVMWHVLEHLPSMDTGLARVRDVLSPGGVIAVAVPNRASAEARVFGARWHGWEPARHRWHLDRDALSRVLEAAGFALDSVETRGGWGYPSALAYSLAPALDPQVNPGRALAGRALAAALVPVAATLRLSGHGGQLLALAYSPFR